jgi:hypothetical protein
MLTVSLVVDFPIHGSSFESESIVFVISAKRGKSSSKTINWAFFVLRNAPSSLLADVWALET